MRRKSPHHLFFGWFMLFGMLFHVLVTHHDGASALFLSERPDGQLRLESALRHAQYHDEDIHHDEHGREPDHADNSLSSEHADHVPAHSHQHLSVDHPEAYLCPSSTDAQDMLSLSLVSLLAILPLRIEQPQTLIKLASVWQIPEPQPPPEQRRLALTTTILLI